MSLQNYWLGHDIPEEVLRAALLLVRWGASHDLKDWTIYGIGPRPFVKATKAEETLLGTTVSLLETDSTSQTDNQPCPDTSPLST